MYKLESAYEERMLVLSFWIWISWLNMFSRPPIFLKIILYSWVEFYCLYTTFSLWVSRLIAFPCYHEYSINKYEYECLLLSGYSLEYTYIYIGVIIAGSYGCPVFNFFWGNFYTGCTSLHSHQQWVDSFILTSSSVCFDYRYMPIIPPLVRQRQNPVVQVSLGWQTKPPLPQNKKGSPLHQTKEPSMLIVYF